MASKGNETRDTYGVIMYVQKHNPDSCTYSMNYSWLTKPCTLDVLQSTVDGDIEGIPQLTNKAVSIHGKRVCAFANESGFLERLPRNELAERFLLALGFSVHLGIGLAGNVCLCADTNQPTKLPDRVLQAIQRGLEAALNEEETTSYGATTDSTRSPILRPALHTDDPCLCAIRQAVENESLSTQKADQERPKKCIRTSDHE
jgi:hypothetical protein